MSTRMYMFAIKSLEPIRNSIGSKNEELLDAILMTLADPKKLLVYPPSANRKFRPVAQAMIMQPCPEAEPGIWSYLLERLAELLDLAPVALPLDEWKHYRVWEDYRRTADPAISPAARELLKLLDFGRPFHGDFVEQEEGVYSWLQPDEVSLLLNDLSVIDADCFGELEDFHEELVESLQEAVGNRHAVVLVAH